ncbi:MAG: M12 family metallopeptidase [Chitinophagaceae bacterium]
MNNYDSHEEDIHASGIPCSIKSLPDRLQARAAYAAMKINPVNAPAMSLTRELAITAVDSPRFLTLATTKYWGATPRKLTVSFMESLSPELRKRIVSHMNAWTKTCCVSFQEISGIGNVRISLRGNGYWSYLGTDILLIPRNRPTMNLQGFSMNTPESEFIRVVRHEAGHTLGFEHEHMRKELVNRIDKQKAYAYFRRTQGWDQPTVDAQVLTTLNEANILGTPPDQTSVMCYQLPADITIDGRPIIGGRDINSTDYAFAGQVYPKPQTKLKQEEYFCDDEQSDWNASDDVQDSELNNIIFELVRQSNGQPVTV